MSEMHGPAWISEGTGAARYELDLYVSGAGPRSLLAIEAVREVCEQQLAGRFDLRVIDVRQQPALAREAQLVALPTLIKKAPGPLRRLVGDMSNSARLLAGLGLPSGRVSV